MNEHAEIIKVLLVEPMKPPRLIEIEHTLRNLQKLVDGYIEALYPWEDRVAIVCDDEARLKNKPFNRVLEDDNGKAFDIISGSFFICGLTIDDFTSIPDELAEKYTEKFRCPELFLPDGNGHISMIRIVCGKDM